MAQNASTVCIQNIAVGHHGITGPASSNETAPVTSGGNVAARNIELFSLIAPLGVVQSPDNLAAILEVVLIFNLALIAFLVHVANIEVHG